MFVKKVGEILNMSIQNNNLYEDSELKDIHYKKVIDLSLVGKTNLYSDLDEIPTEFPSEEHTNKHPIVSEDNDGMLTPEIAQQLKDISRNSFQNIRFIQNNSFGKLDITEKINEFRIVSGQSFNVTGDDVTDIIDMIGSKLVIPGFIPEPGPPGEQGEKGDDGAIWIPSIDENSLVTWTLVLNPTEEQRNISVLLFGKEGPKGYKGSNGKQLIISEPIDNPFLYKDDNTVLNFSKDKTFDSHTLMTIISDTSEYEISYFGFHRYRFARIYKGKDVIYVYDVKKKKFFEFIDECEGYNEESLNCPYNIENIVSKNSFCYSMRTKYLFYIDDNYNFTLI